jgi:hypothetical protein
LASAADDLRRLAVHVESMFALSPAARILRQSPPDNGAGPRLFFGACAGGGLMRFGQDLDEATIVDLEAIAADIPPWTDIDTPPIQLGAMTERLAPATAPEPALIFELPHEAAFDIGARIVRSGETEGERLLERLRAEGMPAHLVEAGFVTLADFWAPWCAVLEGETIAAMGFAARLGPAGADVGVYTFPGFRGRGFAAAVTAAWSSHPDMVGRTLFYSTLRSNASSRRVAQRLGLRRFGLSLSVY